MWTRKKNKKIYLKNRIHQYQAHNLLFNKSRPLKQRFNVHKGLGSDSTSRSGYQNSVSVQYAQFKKKWFSLFLLVKWNYTRWHDFLKSTFYVPPHHMGQK
jgi:hypothetical protein